MMDTFQEEFEVTGGDGGLQGAPIHEERPRSLVYWVVTILRAGEGQIYVFRIEEERVPPVDSRPLKRAEKR